MWQKIKCWLGWHEWSFYENYKKVHSGGVCYYKITGSGYKCKHCKKKLK